MKRFLLSMMTALALTVTVSASQITTLGDNNAGYYNGYGPWQTGIGGEFTFVPDSGLSSVLQYYDSKAKNQVAGLAQGLGSFQSFCVEENEYIYPNSTLEVVLNHRTRYGDQPLTLGAAYLYSQFAQGQLAGYDYDSVSGRHASAQQLQDAIWYYMGQSGPESGNIFENVPHGFDLNNGRYNVAIMNLWVPGHVEQSGYERQDMLVMAKVPDGGMTASLLGLSLSGLVLVARRARKQVG